MADNKDELRVESVDNSPNPTLVLAEEVYNLRVAIWALNKVLVKKHGDH